METHRVAAFLHGALNEARQVGCLIFRGELRIEPFQRRIVRAIAGPERESRAAKRCSAR
jgi:hypothetical protein